MLWSLNTAVLFVITGIVLTNHSDPGAAAALLAAVTVALGSLAVSIYGISVPRRTSAQTPRTQLSLRSVVIPSSYGLAPGLSLTLSM